MGWSEVKAPFHPPLKVWIRGAQGWDCVLSVHCLSLSLLFLCCFHGTMCSLSSIMFLFDCIPKMSYPEIQLLGTCVTNCAHAQYSNAYSKVCLILVILSHLIEGSLLLSPASNNNRDCFLSTEHICVEWLVSTPRKFLAHKNTALVKPRSVKTVCMGKEILQNVVSVWSF